jgi:hypothetical protein
MDERMAPVSDSVPEAEGCFTVILQGSTTWAGVVKGIEGVKETLQRLLFKRCHGMTLEEISDTLVSMADQTAWAEHGIGDGRPYWHWWLGYEGGSVTVQRLTAPLCQDRIVGELRGTLHEVTGILAECARDLRALSSARQQAYVFARRRSDQGPK